jgi:FKBP-type peptidyl-prolyl cis-trans isomerase 2
MLRVIGVPALLVTVFIAAYLSMKDLQSNGPTSPAGQQAIAQADSATAGLDFSQAVPGLQAYFDQNHTYAGATLPPGSQVTLVSADTTSYCLQSGNEHEVGPGGTPQSGPC